MRRLKFVLAGLLISAPAFAQDAPVEGEVGGEVGGEAGGMGAEVNTGEPAPMDPAMTTDGSVPAAGMWSRSAIERPFFRPAGKITAGGDLSFVRFASTDPMTGASSSATFEFITLRGAYAVNDQLSVGLNYAISFGLLDGDAALDGPLTLWGGYQIKHDAKMSLAATGAFSIDVGNTDDMAIGAGLGFRYTVAPKIAVFTGAPYGPGAVGGSGFNGPLLGQLFGGGHLSISLADNGPILFDLPIGAMYQATPELNINLTTTLASIALSNSPYIEATMTGVEEKSAVIFGADYIPLSLGGLYSVDDMLDVTGSFSLFDLKDAGFDALAFSVGVRAHLK